MKTVTLRDARRGNSLAVRVPADGFTQAKLLDGDRLLLTQAPDGTLALTPRQPFDPAAFGLQMRLPLLPDLNEALRSLQPQSLVRVAIGA